MFEALNILEGFSDSDSDDDNNTVCAARITCTYNNNNACDNMTDYDYRLSFQKKFCFPKLVKIIRK